MICSGRSPLWRSMRYYVDLTPETLSLLHLMKFRPSYPLARSLSKALARWVDSSWATHGAWDTIIPIPSSAEGFSLRSFSLPAVLAHELALALPSHTQIGAFIEFRRSHTPQSRRALKDRPRHSRGLFRLAPGANVSGKRVLLVDDLITTGSTVNAASAVLANSGAAAIDVLGWARSRHWRTFQGQLTSREIAAGHP